MQNGEFIAFVEPDRPTQEVFVPSAIDDSKLTSTSREDVLILISRFEAGARFNGVANVVDEFVHDVEVEAKNNNRRALVAQKQAKQSRQSLVRSHLPI